MASVPWLLFENILEDGTLSSSGEASGWPDDNVLDWRVGTAYRWKADNATATAHYLRVDLGTATAQPDTVCIGGHNLFTAGAKYTVRYGTATASMNTAHSAATPSADLPTQTEFSAGGGYRYWDFFIEPTGTAFAEAPQVGVLTLGRRLEFEIGAQPSLDPYGEEPIVEWTHNEGGEFLGANVKYISKKFSISYPNPGQTKATFFQGTGTVNWDTDFRAHARSGNPLWFAWNTGEDTDGVWLCRVDGGYRTPFVTNVNRRELTLNLEAVQEL